MAFAYLLRDNKLRFLALNTFAPHKNKRAKARVNELKAVRERGEKKERL
jgi:hypothetical protein